LFGTLTSHECGNSGCLLQLLQSVEVSLVAHLDSVELLHQVRSDRSSRRVLRLQVLYGLLPLQSNDHVEVLLNDSITQASVLEVVTARQRIVANHSLVESQPECTEILDVSIVLDPLLLR